MLSSTISIFKSNKTATNYKTVKSLNFGDSEKSKGFLFKIMDMKLPNKLKPVYFNYYAKYLKFYSMAINDWIKIGLTSHGYPYELFRVVFRLDDPTYKRTDSSLLSIISTNLRKEETATVMFEFLEYLLKVYLGDTELSRKEFYRVAGVIESELNKTIENRIYFNSLNKEDKCKLLKGTYAAVLFNRFLVSEVK